MKIIVKPAFARDVDRLHDKELKLILDSKITQIEKAKSIEHITGLKLLRTYHVHYRIKVETRKHKYRIGAIIRKETIWLVRFCPRKKIYLEFP
jgi:mRNA-degrading endonuclease RelE of RelBE toxin-antitoxin system